MSAYLSTSKLLLTSFSEEDYIEAWVVEVGKEGKRDNARGNLKVNSMIVLFKESGSPWQP